MVGVTREGGGSESSGVPVHSSRSGPCATLPAADRQCQAAPQEEAGQRGQQHEHAEGDRGIAGPEIEQDVRDSPGLEEAEQEEAGHREGPDESPGAWCARPFAIPVAGAGPGDRGPTGSERSRWRARGPPAAGRSSRTRRDSRRRDARCPRRPLDPSRSRPAGAVASDRTLTGGAPLPRRPPLPHSRPRRRASRKKRSPNPAKTAVLPGFRAF